MIKIGVPSKGRLMEKTFDWFGARGVTMRRTGADREYSGTVEGVDGVELVLLSAGEVPRELAAGRHPSGGHGHGPRARKAGRLAGAGHGSGRHGLWPCRSDHRGACGLGGC